MKVIDETWDAVGTTLAIDQGSVLGRFDFNASAKPADADSYARALERAKLAAQAPAMARLLLDLLSEDLRFELKDLGYTEGIEQILRDAGVIE